ncbi:MAG: hypothetical protein GX443_06905 [Deltaproteobacteria bacterium]|nr:hypothetical protein [Deltaproteobacteria bacterium]
MLETGLESKETMALRGEIRALVRLNGGKITTEARRKSERLEELLSREYATGDIVKVHESLDVVCEPLRALAEKRGADPDAVFQDLFNAKMIAERDLELSGAIGERARLIDKGVDPEAANRVLDALKAEYGEDYQVLEDVSRGVRSWSDAAILEPLVRSGRLNEEVAKLMRKSNRYYVPFFRLMDEMEEKGFVGRGTGIFEVRKIPVSEIKGSERKIMDPLSMLVSLAYRSADAAARATVARTIAEVPLFSQAGEGIEVVRAKFFPVPVELRQEVDPELRAGLQSIADALKVRVEVRERLKGHSNLLGMYAQMVDREASGGLITEEERKWIQLMFGSSERTLAHEVGHAIDAYYAKEKDGKRIGGLVSALMATPEMKRELRAIADRRLGDASSETFKRYVRRREEQVAEFVSLYINDRGLALTMAPNACDAFVRFCSKRDALKPLLGLRPSGKADISTMEGQAWTRSPFPPESNTMLYYRNGAPYWLKMPPDLYRACMGMNPGDVGLAVRLAAKPASWLRSGAVLTPEFISRNPLRDILMAWVFNRHGFSFRGWFSDFFELLGKKEEAKKLFAKFQASGGAFADLATMFLETQKLTVEQIQGKRKGVKYCAHPMEALREISSFVENVTRYSVYRQALENGASNAEAVHEARTITLDYHRFGGSPYIRALNMVIPFFNASIQGIDKVWGELLSGDPKRVLKVLQRITLGITVPSVLLWAMFGDDDRIKNLESWERNLFWHIPLPGGPIIRFPKPFELGIAFGSIPERMLDFASTGDKHGLRQAVAQAFDSVTPPMWPAILRPFAEQSSNWNFFTGRAIEDEAMKNLPAELRSKPWTSEAAKFFSSRFGKYAGISPVMFENHVRSLFGGIGASYVLPMIDFAMRKTGVAKDIPKMDEPVYQSLPFIRALISREAGGFKSKASSDFYENAAKSYTADQGWKALWKRGQIEDAMRMLREHPEAVFAGSARKAMSDPSRIRREREAILADPKMTGDRKRARAAELDSRVDVIVGVQQALMNPRVMERIRAPFIDKLQRSGPTKKDIDSYYDFLNEPVLRAARAVERDWPSIRKLSSRERSERIVGLIKRGQNRGVAVTTGGNQGKNANPILGIPFHESKTLSSESMYQ